MIRRASAGASRARRLRIRRARRADLATLAAMMAASPLLQRYGTTERGAIRALARGIRSGDRVIVVDLAGRTVVGMAWIVPSRILTGAAYLRLLLVAEGWQRLGAGARLLAATEAAARLVANHLVLLATTDNARARRFYARHGYHHVGRLRGLARPGLDEALYWKPLRPPKRRLRV